MSERVSTRCSVAPAPRANCSGLANAGVPTNPPCVWSAPRSGSACALTALAKPRSMTFTCRSSVPGAPTSIRLDGLRSRCTIPMASVDAVLHDEMTAAEFGRDTPAIGQITLRLFLQRQPHRATQTFLAGSTASQRQTAAGTGQFPGGGVRCLHRGRVAGSGEEACVVFLRTHGGYCTSDPKPRQQKSRRAAATRRMGGRWTPGSTVIYMLSAERTCGVT